LREKTGRTATAKIFGKEIRSWRGDIARRDVALQAEVRHRELCVIEHGRVWQVPLQQVLKLLETLQEFKKISKERENRIRKLLKVVSPVNYKHERCCCHKRYSPMRRTG
jgi:hypothetical protein